MNLEELDFTGDTNIGDEGLLLLAKGEIKQEGGAPSIIVGLQKLRILKLNGLVKISDHQLLKVCLSSHVLEHLELTKCENLTEYSIDMLIKQMPTLKFIDINSIPAITPIVLE